MTWSDERAVELALRAARRRPRDPEDEYAEAPTVVFAPDAGADEDDGPTRAEGWAGDPVLVPVEEYPSEDDTDARTAVYAGPGLRPRVDPLAASPASYAPPRGPGAPSARRARREAYRDRTPRPASDYELVGIAIGVAGTIFAAAGVVVVALAYALTGA